MNARTGILCVLGALVAACTGGDSSQANTAATVSKSTASVRAARRAYDGAPPVIPHRPIGASCIACHNEQGVAVEGLGFAPASPHGQTPGMGSTARCVQCHVFRESEDLFRESTFTGVVQGVSRGDRLHPLAPPTVPHGMLLHEQCAACHTGPAAREEIRCTHPERRNCVQCHVPQQELPAFTRQ